jgi:hypothetical protein
LYQCCSRVFPRNQNFGMVFDCSAAILMRMRGEKRTLICVLGSFAVATGVVAISPDAPRDEHIPFQGIVERNVFGLRSPPPPAPPPDPEANRPPPPKLTLTGITTIFGNKRALLSAQVPAKPPEAAKVLYYMLTEGQRDGDVEVLTIDEAAGTVMVKNHNQTQSITFEKEMPKFAPVPGTPPGTPSPVGGVPMPGAPGAGATAGRGYTPPAAGAFNPGTVGVTVGGADTANPAGMRTIPTRQVRTTPSFGMPGFSQGGGPSPESQQPQLTPEEQILIMEVERERTKAQVQRGELPPLPPTPLTPQ